METKNGDEKILQLNDLFDELIEDAYSFSRDISMGIKAMPLASAFMFVSAIGYAWININFLEFKSHLFRYLHFSFCFGTLIFCAALILYRYYQMKKKYSRLLNIKEELDTIKGK